MGQRRAFRWAAAVLAAALSFSRVAAVELPQTVPELTGSSPVSPSAPSPLVVPLSYTAASAPQEPALSVTPERQPFPDAVTITAAREQVVQLEGRVSFQPQGPAPEPAAVAQTFSAAYDHAVVTFSAPAQPVVATSGGCPFHRILGLAKSSTDAPAPKTAPRKPSSPWVLKFSPWQLLKAALKHYWDLLRGKDPFRGFARPPRAHLIPLLEIAIANLSNPVRGLEALHERYGDASYYESPAGQRVFFVSDPKAVSRILNQTDRASGTNAFEKSEIGIGGIAKLTGRHTIFLGLADRWRQRRQLMQPFLFPRAIHTDAAADKVRAIVDRGLDDLGARARNAGPGGLGTKVSDEMSTLTMRVILELLFGVEAPRSELVERVGPAFAEVTRTVPLESLNPFTVRISEAPLIYRRRRQLKEAYRILDRFAQRILDAGRARTAPRGDLLDALLSAKSEDGAALTDEEIKNEILTMILAGHETTSATATWALYSLSRRPDALARLRAEVEDGPADPDYEALKDGYGFLGQVIQETLRLYTPAYVLFRKAVEDAQVPLEDGGALFVPQGSHVVLSTFVTHRRPRQWEATGFNAAGFFPERFDELNLERRGLKRADLVSFPFGHGPRMCLGQSLSLLETQLILIRFLQRFGLEPVSARPARIVSDIGVKLDDGFPARIRPL